MKPLGVYLIIYNMMAIMSYLNGCAKPSHPRFFFFLLG